jgi:hypothetical protein
MFALRDTALAARRFSSTEFAGSSYTAATAETHTAWAATLADSAQRHYKAAETHSKALLAPLALKACV